MADLTVTDVRLKNKCVIVQKQNWKRITNEKLSKMILRYDLHIIIGFIRLISWYFFASFVE